MPDYSRAARRWIEPLLALCVGGEVSLRFLSPVTDSQVELGIVPPGEGTYVDYPAPGSHVRELTMEELATFAGQFRQGAREVLLSDAFAADVAAAQGLTGAKAALEAAAGVLIGGQICRIHGIKPLDYGAEVTAWQFLCDAPLEAG